MTMTTITPKPGYRPLRLADILDVCNDGSLAHLNVRTMKPEAARRETDAHGADIRFFVEAISRGKGDERETAIETLDYVRDNIEGYGTCPNGEAGVFISATYSRDPGPTYNQVADEGTVTARLYIGGSIRNVHIDWRDL